jgi:hypothetical protein
MRYTRNIPNGFSRMASLRFASLTNYGSHNYLVSPPRVSTALLPNPSVTRTERYRARQEILTTSSI